jgi:hypothetical protein
MAKLGCPKGEIIGWLVFEIWRNETRLVIGSPIKLRLKRAS